MSVSVTVAGVSYTIPTVGDVNWGPQVTAWIQAISAVTLQTSGGAFTLTSDLNFGTSFGLISKYFTSVSANASATGAIRLANADAIGWRNSGNSADILLQPDADGVLKYGGIDLVNLSATQSLTNKTFNSTSTATGIRMASWTPDGTHTLTAPTATDTLALLTAIQTLTNKTLTSPAISSPAITGVASLAAGAVNAPALTFTGDPTNGLYHIGANHWGLAVNGAEAIDLNTSSSSFGNVGLGGPASTSDNFPLLVLRTQVGTTQVQITNGDTGAGSGTKLQVFADAGSNQMEVSAFTAATASPDIYAGGRGVVRAAGALAGLSLIADSTGTSDVRLYAGGDGIANRIGTFDVSGLTLGVTSNLAGKLNLAGATSGLISILTQAAAGTYNFNLPATVGSAGTVLTSQGGGSSAMTWSSVVTNPMTTGGDLIYGGSSGVPTRLANGSSGQYLMSNGTTLAPSWATAFSPTEQKFTSTGTATGRWFTVSSANATVGATYTNNGQTFTVLATIASATQLFTSGAGTPLTSGTLTKASGTGDATITFSAAFALASYTPTAGARLAKITVVGAGGGGGGTASVASSSGAGGGGGGGGVAIKWIPNPSGTYYYSVGTGGNGGAAGNNGGAPGIQSTFNITVLGGGANGGGGSAGNSSGARFGGAASLGGVASGGDLNCNGSGGDQGIILGLNEVVGGAGAGNGFAPRVVPGSDTTQTGPAGTGYGGGGAGGQMVNNGGAVGGGNGASGLVLVEEF